MNQSSKIAPVESYATLTAFAAFTEIFSPAFQLFGYAIFTKLELFAKAAIAPVFWSVGGRITSDMGQTLKASEPKDCSFDPSLTEVNLLQL